MLRSSFRCSLNASRAIARKCDLTSLSGAGRSLLAPTSHSGPSSRLAALPLFRFAHGRGSATAVLGGPSTASSAPASTPAGPQSAAAPESAKSSSGSSSHSESKSGSHSSHSKGSGNGQNGNNRRRLLRLLKWAPLALFASKVIWAMTPYWLAEPLRAPESVRKLLEKHVAERTPVGWTWLLHEASDRLVRDVYVAIACVVDYMRNGPKTEDWSPIHQRAADRVLKLCEVSPT